MLPGQGGAKLHDPGDLFGQGQVAAEKDADPGGAGGGQDARDLGDDLVAAFDLAEDADLHVVDQQGHLSLRVADLLQRPGDD